LEEWGEVSSSERQAIRATPFSLLITPYYANLLKNPALRRTVVPLSNELNSSENEFSDPLGEEDHRATPHLIHTYPDKALFLATSHCAVHCRYCTRSRLVGKESPVSSDFEESFRYLETHAEIRDVLVSGGDPLTLSDEKLNEILGRIRAIPHIRTLRVGSKVPAVLPMRITSNLCSLLRRYQVWLSLHFTHPAELTPACRSACRMLLDHGIPMVSQTVLLKGINDDIKILEALFYGLLETGVKPYYLLQCDPIQGSASFRTPVEKGIALIRALHGRISGLAVPQFVIDAPGGGGKVPILSPQQIRREGDFIFFKNREEIEFSYPDKPIEKA
jgi:lysine 2,3-aminomutase